MPYDSVKDLPEQTKDLSSEQKKRFKAAFNAAYEQHGEKRAFKIAWAAAKGDVDKHLKGQHDQKDHGKWTKQLTGGMSAEQKRKVINSLQGESLEESMAKANKWLMAKGKTSEIEYGVLIDDGGKVRDVLIGRKGSVIIPGVREPGLMGWLKAKSTKGMHITHLHPFSERTDRIGLKPLSSADVVASLMNGTKSITAVTPQGAESTLQIELPESRKDRRKMAREVYEAAGEFDSMMFEWAGFTTGERGIREAREMMGRMKEFGNKSKKAQIQLAGRVSRKADDHWNEHLNKIEGLTYSSTISKAHDVFDESEDRSSESRPKVGPWLESEIHRHFTNLADGLYGRGKITREERIALSSAIGDALGAYNKTVERKVPEVMRINKMRWSTPDGLATLVKTNPEYVAKAMNKHLLGQHTQEDHDPAQGHKRSQHKTMARPQAEKAALTGTLAGLSGALALKPGSGRVTRGMYGLYALYLALLTAEGAAEARSLNVEKKAGETIGQVLERLSEASGVRAEQVLEDLGDYMISNKIMKPNKDDIHEFMIESYGHARNSDD